MRSFTLAQAQDLVATLRDQGYNARPVACSDGTAQVVVYGPWAPAPVAGADAWPTTAQLAHAMALDSAWSPACHPHCRVHVDGVLQTEDGR